MADWAEKIAIDILGVCSCHEGYVIRNMIDPACVWHDCGEELIAALRATAVEYERKGLERAVAEAKNYTAPPIIGQDCRTAEAVLITRKRIVAAIQSLIDQGPSEAITPASPGDG